MPPDVTKLLEWATNRSLDPEVHYAQTVIQPFGHSAQQTK
jgi:hypothetical protein